MNALRRFLPGRQIISMMRIAHSTALSPLVFSTLISCALFGKSAVLAEGTQLSEGNTPECCAKSTNKALPMLKVNDKAPDFRLLSQSGKSIKLSELLGKSVVVVYFYPKDFTSICTKESKAFRDSYEVFKQAGAEVVGISADSVESHKSFAEAEHLPFILLSDSDDRVRKLWRVPNSMGFLPGRVTYVIDKRGVIRSVFDAQLEDKKHVTEALKVIDQLKKESSSKS